MTPHVQSQMAGKAEAAEAEAEAPVVVDEDLPMLKKSYDETDEEGLHHGACGMGGDSRDGVGDGTITIFATGAVSGLWD